MSTTTLTPRSTTAHDTFQNQPPATDTPLPRGWTRRGFLGALSAVTVATVSGCGIPGADDELNMAGSNGGGLGTGRGGGPATAGGAPYTPVAPFGLAAACELSEDYFLVENHLIDPAKDTVMAYSRADGLVEAIVLQGGSVKQIYRDPTQPGGWNVNPLPDADGVTHMVAGVSAPLDAVGRPLPAPPALRVFYTKAESDQLWVASQTLVDEKTSTTFGTQHVPWTDHAADLQITFNANETLLVSAMKPSTDLHSGDAQLWFCHDTGGKLNQGTMTGFSYDPAVYGDWAAVGTRYYLDGPVPQLYLYLPGGVDQDMNEDPSLHLWKAPLDQGQLVGTLQDSRLGAVKPPPHLDIIDVAYLTALRSQWMPTALIWTVHDDQGDHAGGPQLWAVTWDTKAWVWTELVLPTSINHDVGGAFPISTALTPRSNLAQSSAPDRQLLDVFMVANDTLHVLRQIEQANPLDDTKHPIYTPLIPLQPGVAAMTSQAAVSTGNELLLVGTDKMLQTLEKDPVSGRWTDAEIQVPATALQSDSSYRVTLTLTDTAWNAPVKNQALKITASTPAPASVAGPSGPVTVFLGAEPVTVTTDQDGEVMIAILADGLSAPTLTVTATGMPKPVNVYPSGAINTYMQGGSTLNYLPTMNAATLSDASTTDGSVVPKGTTDVAVQVDTMKQAATWGAQGSATNTMSSTFGRVDGGRIHGTRHQRRRSPQLSTKALGSNLDNWAHDVFHAVKKGATSVETVTIDAEKKIVTFAVDAAGWVNNEVQIVVHTIEDAAHVLHAAFNKLKADIWHAVKWLEAEVLGVFTSANALADKFERWIATFSSFAATTLAADKTKVVNGLKGEQQWVTNEMTSLTDRFSSKTTLSNLAQNPPTPAQAQGRPGRSTSTNGPRAGSDNSPAPLHGDWFYRKIKHELTGSGLKIDLSNTPDLKDKLTAFGQKSLAHSVGFQNRFIADFWKGFISGVVHHPDDVDDVLIQPLLQALLTVVNDAFDYAENIVAEAFDLLHDIAASIPTLLNGTTLKDLPILGAVMGLIGLKNVSIGRVANLIFAFPTALAYKIAHGASAQPFAATATKGSRGTVGDVASDLQICAASVMGTWAVFDTISAAFVAGGSDGGMLFNAIDIAAPLIVTILTTPAVKDGEPFFTPPVTGDAADILGFLAWVLGAIPAFCAAVPLFIEKFMVKDEGSEAIAQMTAWFQALTGVLALICGMVANSQKATPKGADYAGAVLNNMSTIAGAGLTQALIDATVGISVVVAMALTLICGELGATVFGVDG